MSDDAIKNLQRSRWTVEPPLRFASVPFTVRHTDAELTTPGVRYTVGNTKYTRERSMKIKFPEGIDYDKLPKEEQDAIELEHLERQREVAIRELEALTQQIDELKNGGKP